MVSSLQSSQTARPSSKNPSRTKNPPQTLAEIEREAILSALQRTGGNKAEAARQDDSVFVCNVLKAKSTKGDAFLLTKCFPFCGLESRKDLGFEF
ncbi:MAG: helix-turn-helix domain-containing protein [Myxococcota bacterium]